VVAVQAKHFKFTFQLSYWDFFKEMTTFKAHRLRNMALLLAFLVRHGTQAVRVVSYFCLVVTTC